MRLPFIGPFLRARSFLGRILFSYKFMPPSSFIRILLGPGQMIQWQVTWINVARDHRKYFYNPIITTPLLENPSKMINADAEKNIARCLLFHQLCSGYECAPRVKSSNNVNSIEWTTVFLLLKYSEPKLLSLPCHNWTFDKYTNVLFSRRTSPLSVSSVSCRHNATMRLPYLP